MSSTRKLAILATAAIGLAASAAGGPTAPPAHADDAAAPCKQWQIDHNVNIRQSNRWLVTLQYRDGRWQAWGTVPGSGDYIRGKATFSRFDADEMRFAIAWNNGSGGIYKGFIDDHGFVSGTSYDRWDRRSRANWRMQETLDCIDR